MSTPVYAGQDQAGVTSAVAAVKGTLLDLARGGPEGGKDMKAAVAKIEEAEKDIAAHFEKASAQAKK